MLTRFGINSFWKNADLLSRGLVFKLEEEVSAALLLHQ
jgi:hypothetical protein